MSLVNDLLIEIDRREGEERMQSANYLKGLAPTNTSDRTIMNRALFFRATALFCVVSFISFALAIILRSPFVEPSPIPSLPAVAARPSAPEVPAKVEPPTAKKPQSKPTVTQVSIENTELRTRLRLDTLGTVAHSLEQRGTGSLDLHLQKVILTEALELLDLADTPIRAFETNIEDEGVTLSFQLAPDTETHSQSLETTQGTTIFIDFKNGPEEEKLIASRTTPSSPPAALDPAPKRVKPKNPPAPSSWASRPRASSAPSRLPSVQANAAQPLGIARSSTDHLRVRRNQARRQAEQAVNAARIAVASGDLVRAVELYTDAIEFDPDSRPALLEAANTLGKAGRVDEAVRLLTKARHHAPKDAELLMFQARLLDEAGRTEESVALLEASSLSLTESPEVHARTAAYLQKIGRHEAAIDRFETVVRRYPGEARWWMGLGISLEASNRSEEALDVYRIAVQLGELSQPTRRWVSTRIDALGAEG